MKLVGNIAGKTFTVNAPNADIIDETTGGTINVIDAANSSYYYNGSSAIVWSDNGGRFVNETNVAADLTLQSNVVTLTVSGKIGTVVVEGATTITVEQNTTIESTTGGATVVDKENAPVLTEAAAAVEAALKSLNDLVAVSDDEGYIQFKTLLETHADVFGLQAKAESAYDALKDEQGVRVGAQLAVAKDVLANMPVGGFESVEDVKIAFDNAVDFRTWTANYVTSAKTHPTEEELFTKAIAELKELNQDFKIQGDSVNQRLTISTVVSNLELLKTAVSQSAETREIDVDQFLTNALLGFEGISFGQVLAKIQAGLQNQ